MTTDGGSAGTAAANFRATPADHATPRPRNGDDPTEPGRRANTGRHRAPIPAPRLTHRQVAGIAAGGLAALTVTIGLAALYAPDATHPRAATLPTAAEQVREPSGHGGDVGPLATPSIGADGAWQPEDGPVIVDGTPLETPQPEQAEAPPEPGDLPMSNAPAARDGAETQPTAQAPEPQPEPVDEPPLPPLDDVDDVTVPDPAPEPTDPEQQPEQPPADPEPATEPQP